MIIEKKCSCCSGKNFSECCHPFIEGKFFPLTAVQLMRSRYSAYSLAKIDYIKKTMCGLAAKEFNETEAAQWASSVKWCGLKILNPGFQTADLNQDEVEFIARYIANECLHILHERSQFEKINEQWFYVASEKIPEPVIRLNRRDSCPCGSKRRFYLCCGKSWLD